MRLQTVAVVIGLTACSTGDAGSAPGTQPEGVDCVLPWDSMAQVVGCAGDDYELIDANGNQVNIVVEAEDADVIAAALADAFLRNEDNADEIVVWAWSDESAIGTGYDRGVASEQGQLGELLVFEVCATWMDMGDGLIICEDIIDFTVEQ